MTKIEVLKRLKSIREYLYNSDFDESTDEYFIEINGVLLKIDDLAIENYESSKYGKSQYLKLMLDGKLLATVVMRDLVSVL